jgi:tetratricopeptide (TPR) repeat protein
MVQTSHLSRDDLKRRVASIAARRAGVRIGLKGAAGVGKSFAVQAAIDYARLRHLIFAANSTDSAQAKTWLLALGAGVRQLPQQVQTALRRMARGDALEGRDVAQVFAISAISLAPCLIVVEDWHEATPAQREAWQQRLGGFASAPGAGVLVTSRDALPTDFEAFSLEGLSETESAALLQNEWGTGTLPPLMLEWVWTRTRGNPLFALEYLRDLRRQGQLWLDGGACHWREPVGVRLPTTVEAFVERTLDRVTDPAALHLLEAHALLGQHFEANDNAFWSAVTGLEPTELQATQVELEGFGLFNPSGLSHPLYREVSAARINRASRLEIARRACAYLESRDPIRAAQFAASAELGAERTLELHLNAAILETDPLRAVHHKAAACEFAVGEQALQLALESARVLIQADLKPVPRVTELGLRVQPDHLELLGLRARALARGGNLTSALELLTRIPEGQRDPAWWRWHALALLEAQDFAALYQLGQSRPELHLQDDAELTGGFAHWYVRNEDFEAAEELFAISLSKNTHPTARARLMLGQGVLMSYQRRWEEAQKQLLTTIKAFLDAIPKRLLANSWFNLGLMAQHLGCLTDAAERYTRSAQINLETGDDLRYATAQSSLAVLYYHAGHFEAAERAFLEARNNAALRAPSGDSIDRDGWLSDLYTVWSPPHGGALSLKYAHAGLRTARQIQDEHKLYKALYYAICAEITHGQVSVAERLCDEMATLSCPTHEAVMVVTARGITLDALGDRTAAIRMQQRALEMVADEAAQQIGATQIRLELARMHNDLEAARVELNYFRSIDFHPGLVLAERYFPALRKTVPAANPSAEWSLEVLGEIRLVSRGEVTPVRGAKRKALLALLLEAHLVGHAEARSTDLCAALYPNATDDEGKAAVKQLVFQLRAQLGAESLQTTPNGYALQGVDSDAERFLRGGDTRLWRGPYLADSEELGGRGLEPLGEALYTQLKRRVEAILIEDAAESARAARILLESEPFDTSALVLALRALQAQGNYVGISRMYKRSRETWLEVGEHLPERWTEFLEASPTG